MLNEKKMRLDEVIVEMKREPMDIQGVSEIKGRPTKKLDKEVRTKINNSKFEGKQKRKRKRRRYD